MLPAKTRYATNNFIQPSNWDEKKLGQCHDLQVRSQFHAPEVPILEMVSTWKPTAAELAHLVAGGVIEIGLMQPTQPPMWVTTVDPVDGISYRDHEHDRKARTVTINEEAHGHDEHGPAYPG